MKTLASFLVLAVALVSSATAATPDWLINPAPFKARVTEDAARHELVMENGLVRRALRLAPNAATVDYRSLVTGEQLLRATGPEAVVTINGREYAIGGLEGQPVKNYLKAKWIDDLRANPAAYRFAGMKVGPLEPRMAWKKHPEWLPKDYPWPPPGRQVSLRFIPPAANRGTNGRPCRFRGRLRRRPQSRVENPCQRQTPALVVRERRQGRRDLCAAGHSGLRRAPVAGWRGDGRGHGRRRRRPRSPTPGARAWRL